MLLTRRAIMGAGLAGLVAPRLSAANLTVPLVDRLQLTVLADGTVSRFIAPVERPGLMILPPSPVMTSYRLTLRAELGYSVCADAFVDGARHRVLIDFGYTPEALTTNMAMLGVDPTTIDAMVLSHGHYDHFGGLPAVLGRVRQGTPLYLGGEEVFCARLRGRSPDAPAFGELEKHDLVLGGLDLRIAPGPQVVAGAAFTTGRIPLTSAERPMVPTSMLPGQGCRRADLDPDRRDLDFFADDLVHELGTAFHLRGKGLVIIGSCSHRGIINTVLAARAASGVQRVHAVMGGFHLVAPQTQEQVAQTLALMTDINPRFIFPGHCTGAAFISAALSRLPEQTFRTVVGSRIELT